MAGSQRNFPPKQRPVGGLEGDAKAGESGDETNKSTNCQYGRTDV